nr:MAG TPA: beta-catenin [Caudoviricetes sp.]
MIVFSNEGEREEERRDINGIGGYSEEDLL